MPAGRPRTYTNQELEDKINEYFEHIDSNPLFKYEQRKGNIIIPKAFEGTPEELAEINESSLIKIPLPKIYLEGQLCVEWLGFDRDYLTETLKKIDNWMQENKDKTDEETDKLRSEKIELVGIITRAKDKCSSQKIQLAGAGLANPMIVSRLEGLTDKQDVTSNGETISLNVSVNNCKVSNALDNE